jgi:hypothetical protein
MMMMPVVEYGLSSCLIVFRDYPRLRLLLLLLTLLLLLLLLLPLLDHLHGLLLSSWWSDHPFLGVPTVVMDETEFGLMEYHLELSRSSPLLPCLLWSWWSWWPVSTAP